jgi:hypothetical protein
MKHLKLVGLAALAVMAAIVAGGAGTASATVLCTATETPCSESKLVKASTEIQADLAYLKRSFFSETSNLIFESCTGNTLTTQVIKKGGAAETVTSGVTALNFTWSGCEAGGVVATETGELEIHHIAGTDNGTLTGKGFGIKFLKTECTYAPSPTVELGQVRGPSGGLGSQIVINTVLYKSGGGLFCLPDIRWTATFDITKPTPLYVVAS